MSATFSRTIKGWLAACWAATVVICGFTLSIVAISAGGLSPIRPMGGAIQSLLFAAALIFVVIAVLSGIPASVAIWLSERFRIRSVLFFGCAGAVTGALSRTVLLSALTPWPPTVNWLYVIAGCTGGMAYWLIAGRHAGRDCDLSGDPA